MDVLVAGGTGFIGRALCEVLVDRGHTVRALARSPEDADVPPSVETVAGDVTDRSSIEGHVAGHDAVYNLVAPSPLFKLPRRTTHHDIHYDGTVNLLDLAEAADIDRFVQVSAIDAGEDAPTEHLRAKGRAERAVEGSAIDGTIIRPSVVFGEGGEFLDFCRWVSFPPFTGALVWPHVTPLPGAHSRFQPIWRRDLVAMLAACLEDEAHLDRTYELGGPTQYALAAIVRLVHRAEGKPARIVPVPTGLAKVPLHVGQYVPGFPLGADQARALDVDNVTDANDVGAFDREPGDLRTLETYLGL